MPGYCGILVGLGNAQRRPVAGQVADTPAHIWPGQGCLVGDDSCPELPGLDPIHNYMSYAEDFCRNQFTPGQAARAHDAWAAYRE